MHVADLIEKQGAAVGLFEFADVGGHRASERTTVVAEQLAFQQMLGNGGAIDRDIRFIGSQRKGLNGAGDQLLA